MNFDILWLFVNATLTTVISAGVVIRILLKEYRPVIKALKEKESGQRKNK